MRILALLGAGAVLAVASVLLAAPAAAAGTSSDLQIGFTGSTIAANADGKFADVLVSNNGPGTPTDVSVAFDIGALDTSKVILDLSGTCTTVSTVITCPIPDANVPAPHETFQAPVPLVRQVGASGAAGSLTITITSSTNTDPNSANDTATGPVSVGTSGPDLFVSADDVYLNPATRTPVPPGGSASVVVFIGNFGDLAAAGLHVSVGLPDHATFASTEPGCTNSSDNMTTVCDYPSVTLEPFDITPDSSSIELTWPITVASDAPAPGALPDGLASAEPIDSKSPTLPAPKLLPPNATWHTLTSIDADPGDDSDGFVIFVGAPGNGDHLPKTGSPTVLYTGIGIAAVGVGAGLVLLSRRRRVAPVRPGNPER